MLTSASMIANCRSCGSGDVRKVFSLGLAPLANRLSDDEGAARAEPRYPLDLCVCAECGLAQLGEAPPPREIFSDYPYLSSFSDTMVEHARELAGTLIRECSLDGDAPVVEIGSNDGYLLQHFADAGVPTLGIDPAEAACELAAERGIETRREFFGEAVAEELAAEGIAPRVIAANNVMAHVPDVNDVVAGVRRLLAPDGVLVVETPYLRDLVERLEFDTIYHEHLFYYSLTSLRALLARHGLGRIDVVRVPIHGGSLRVFARHGSETSDAAERLLAEEAEWGVRDPATYSEFSARVDERLRELREILAARKRQGRRLAAYGAAAKGVMLLNALEVAPDVLDFVVDRNPQKQGRRLPGSGLPIRPPEDLLTEMPDDVLLLAWNVGDEVIDQQAEYRRRGGTFIVPLPELRVVNSP
jgi:SAM-dependent methyltransferase